MIVSCRTLLKNTSDVGILDKYNYKWLLVNTLNKITFGNSYKCTFRTCNFPIFTSLIIFFSVTNKVPYSFVFN